MFLWQLFLGQQRGESACGATVLGESGGAELALAPCRAARCRRKRTDPQQLSLVRNKPPAGCLLSLALLQPRHVEAVTPARAQPLALLLPVKLPRKEAAGSSCVLSTPNPKKTS